MAGLNDQILYLFSSTARPIYKEDIYNALANPNNFIMHFRYRKDWVVDHIWNATDLQNKEVLICAAIRNKTLYDFYPIRKGTIIKTEKDGTMFHVYFKLLPDWVDYTGINDEYNLFIRSMGDSPRIINDKFSGKFIFTNLMGEIKFSTGPEVWEGIIKKISTDEEFKRGVFYKLTKVIEIPNNKDLALQEILIPLTRGYEFYARRNYSFEFTINFGKEPPLGAGKAIFKGSKEKIP